MYRVSQPARRSLSLPMPKNCFWFLNLTHFKLVLNVVTWPKNFSRVSPFDIRIPTRSFCNETVCTGISRTCSALLRISLALRHLQKLSHLRFSARDVTRKESTFNFLRPRSEHVRPLYSEVGLSSFRTSVTAWRQHLNETWNSAASSGSTPNKSYVRLA
jgi:hypothetical protein